MREVRKDKAHQTASCQRPQALALKTCPSWMNPWTQRVTGPSAKIDEQYLCGDGSGCVCRVNFDIGLNSILRAAPDYRRSSIVIEDVHCLLCSLILLLIISFFFLESVQHRS